MIDLEDISPEALEQIRQIAASIDPKDVELILYPEIEEEKMKHLDSCWRI